VDEKIDLIRDGKALAVIAEDDEMFRFAVLMLGHACPRKLRKYQSLDQIAYIKDVVVGKNPLDRESERNSCLSAFQSRRITTSMMFISSDMKKILPLRV